MRRTASASLILALCPLVASGMEQRLDTDITMEGRWFWQQAADPRQGDAGASISLQPEWYAQWRRGDISLTVTPFGRWDSMDEERSHLDLREFHVQALYRAFELRLGVSRVFWGRTEFLHLVDIINQDDAIENIDGEDKLGQPMLKLGWSQGPVSLQGFLLPAFRERSFAGAEGRLRPPLPVNSDRPLYQSSEEDRHLDYALRLQGYVGALDYGLSWFSGTHRDPQLLPVGFVDSPDGPQPTDLRPWYGQLDQAGLDAQYTLGSWLLKLEAVWRDEHVLRQNPDGSPALAARRYAAATGGFEYTAYGVFDSAMDIGWLAEYQWDERGRRSAAAFQNDLFLGARLVANDVADSSLLAGVLVDLEHGSRFASIEASRRLSGSSKLELELRLFNAVAPEDENFHAIRQDDHLRLTWSYYL